jgi:hypothetical protein
LPYALEKMLAVRVHRENKAMNRVVHCQEEVSRALDLSQRRETEFSEFRSWRIDEERRLFRNLQEKPAAVQDVMMFMDTTSALREDQAVKAQQVVEAREQVKAAEADLLKARQDYVAAYRKKVKIEEHKAVWEEEDRFRVEQDAEKEMEEFVHTKVAKH